MSQPNQNNNNFKDTKIFVGGLAWRTTTDDLRRFFEQYGEVIDANVVSGSLPGGKLRSKGYGFVVFRDPESANRACELSSQLIDGRQADVKMAYIGAKNNTNQSNQNALPHQAGPSHQYQNGLLNQVTPHQYQLASQYPTYQYFPPPNWVPYYGQPLYMHHVPCYSYSTAMVSTSHVSAYRAQRYWQRMNNQPSVIISAPPNAPIIENNDKEADTKIDSDQEGEIIATLQSEEEEAAKNTLQANGNGHEEQGEQEEGEGLSEAI
ncbi:unnamed protein product [Eruca vesicaria subsp. sativa]|uniref:RRM domain-containing protein n=1 Tax=Eruca vesicaria subsp. sativa TaxID=29727 RepID=A0ABC8JVJ7_ERUVS|nr:unnamed protein product [Eruca vesicaria subsp. sativa]